MAGHPGAAEHGSGLCSMAFQRWILTSDLAGCLEFEFSHIDQSALNIDFSKSGTH